MTKVNPTNDLAFKKVFASNENKGVLKGLIKDFFNFEPDDIIISNPYDIKVYRELIRNEEMFRLRQTVADITASLITADFTAEMQVRKEKYFDERALYYPQQLWRNYFNGEPVPDNAPDYIRQAAQIIDYTNMGEEEKKMLDQVQYWQSIWDSVIERAVDDSREESLAKGRAEGLAEGRNQVIKKLLLKMDMQRVAEITDLPIAELEQLINE